MVFWLVPIASICALGMAWFFFKQMMREDEGTPRMKEIAAAFGTLDQPTISAIQASGDYTLALPGGDVVLHAEDYSISSEDMPGWLVASEGSMTIALDIEITPALKQEGTARELINRIQNVRKDSGLDVTDRITVQVYAEGEAALQIESSLESFGEYVASQTLARSVVLSPTPVEGMAAEWEESNITIRVSRI